jgi:hypothetical protein
MLRRAFQDQWFFNASEINGGEVGSFNSRRIPVELLDINQPGTGRRSLGEAG